MSFRTQYLANAFPVWTKIHKDRSSLGQRLFETFAEMSTEQTITAIKILNDEHLLKQYLGVGCVYNAILNEEDEYPYEVNSSGVTQYSYPTVVGKDSYGTHTLERIEDLITFLNVPPDRLSLIDTNAFTSYIVWDSSAITTYVNPPWPERLFISVLNSTFYTNRTEERDRAYSGLHKIQVIGTDENDLNIREYIQVDDDGYFFTKNIFKTVTNISYEGFNGQIIVKWFPVTPNYIVDPFRTAVISDATGPLHIALNTMTVSAVNYSYLSFTLPIILLGQLYRRPELTDVFADEAIGDIVLLDANELPFTAVDMCINYQTAKLYVLDNTGRVHIYEHDLPSFTQSDYADTETCRNYMELIPLRSFVKLGDTELLFTDFKRYRANIIKIVIKRTAPDGTVNYLQSDKITWGASIAYIVASDTDAELPENSWQDFSFTTAYDQLGQWEYTLTCYSSIDTTIATTAVLVGSLIAERSIETAISNPEAICIDKNDYVSISANNNIYSFQELYDVWIADVISNQVIMRTEYDSVEVKYNG